jgi:DNA polymerase-3 subunit delta'
MVLMPETLRRTHEWPLVDDKLEGEDSKRKPSRQIRIGEVRALIDWSTKTCSRGKGKVAVVHPADALNVQSANSLLKTLEEPPAGTRLVLTTADPALLLPTLRSRCQLQVLAAPGAEAAAGWLQGQGLADAQVLLAACSGRPLDAMAWMKDGIDSAAWAALPAAVFAGRAQMLAGWPIPRVVDALHKLCHDAMAVASGAPPVYFPNVQIAAQNRTAVLRDLAAWSHELDRVARHDDHPWNEGLLIEALVAAGAAAAQGRDGPHSLGGSRARLDTLQR